MKNVYFFLLLCIPFSAHFQIIDEHLLDGMNMRHIGPGTMSGRVTSIDVVESNPNLIYIGTASGGVWKSESGGITWEPVFDDQKLLSIGAIAIDQNNPSVLWAGTGEGNPRNSHSSGGGIYKSLDAGRTWELKGLEATMNIHRIIVDPNNPDHVYVAALGSIWGSNKERGIFKTTDGGATWLHVLKLGDETGCAELVMDPSNPKKLFASMWEFGRQPWFFTSGGPTSALMMTVDGGENWTALDENNGLPSGEYGRIGIAIAESNPKVVYALVEAESTGLYRSNDGGYSWNLQATE
ncbi:MAG: WD40/YVTN/BNR-like repeat-containing protein, partial [Flavobacteriales bacterium]